MSVKLWYVIHCLVLRNRIYTSNGAVDPFTPEGVFMAEPLSLQQRPLGEDALAAQKSASCIDAASTLPPSGEGAKRRCERQSNSFATPAMAPVGPDGEGEKTKDAVTRTKEVSGFDEPDLSIPARQKDLVSRVLRQWKRTARRRSQKSTPSESWSRHGTIDDHMPGLPWVLFG